MSKAAIQLSTVLGLVAIGCGNTNHLGTAESADTETCITIRRGAGGTVADTFIKPNLFWWNFGGLPWLGSSSTTESLLRFDLSAVPAGAPITRASLKLFVSETGNGSVEVHRISAPWSEHGVTYANFKQQFARDLSGAFVPETRRTFKSVDLTNLVSKWASGTVPNYGVLLKPGPDHHSYGWFLDEDLDPTILVSSEGFDVARRPALEVCYSVVTVDPCQDNPCQNGGTCTAQGDQYTCECAAGYTGTNCETNINDCAGNPCQHGGTCADGVNSYTCTCLDGYSGTNCETDINDCDPNPCQNGGVCQDGVASYTCTCPSGYDGANCEHLIDNCISAPCHNGGTCINGVGTYTCQCASGFSGDNCDVNNDDCVGNQCENGGTCVDGINSYTCSCPPDWGGDFCEVNLNECAQQPCLNGGACTNTFGSYFCTCADGYTGANCEVNIDDCSPNPCQNGGACIDGIASFTCQCTAGFSGMLCEIPDPSVGLGGTTINRGAGFELSGANFRSATASVYLDNILGCVVPVLADGSFHTTSCFSDVGSAFRYFPEGSHTLTVTGGDFTSYAQVSFIGSWVTADGTMEMPQAFMLDASNIEGTAFTDWWIAGRHGPVTAWGNSFQQPVTLTDFDVALVATGSKSVTVRTRLSDGNTEQLVGMFDSKEPGITLDHGAGPPGDTVVVSGEGFTGSVTVAFGDNPPAAPINVDASGHFAVQVAVPVTNGGGRGGPYAGTNQTVRVVGSTGRQSMRVSAPFMITGTNNSAIQVAPVTVPYFGTLVTVTGSAFEPSNPFPVTVAVGLDANVVATTSTDLSGNFSATFPLPADNTTSHSPWVVNATDGRGHRASYVLPVSRPAISLDSSSATVGGVVTATLSNLNPANTYKVYVDDILVGASVANVVVIPITRDLRPGAQHTVSVVDMSIGFGNGITHATAQLTLAAPAASAGVSSNADGTQLSVTGSSFAPNQVVSLSVDQQSLGTAQVLPDGTFAFTSPVTLAPAVHTVLVSSGDGVEKAAASVATH